MHLLEQNFNPSAAAGVMCRSLVSVGYDGRLYDCDFNQMLALNTLCGKKVSQLDSFDEIAQRIQLGDHCYGCTAGAGSSCGGALA